MTSETVGENKTHGCSKNSWGDLMAQQNLPWDYPSSDVRHQASKELPKGLLYYSTASKSRKAYLSPASTTAGYDTHHDTLSDGVTMYNRKKFGHQCEVLSLEERCNAGGAPVRFPNPSRKPTTTTSRGRVPSVPLSFW